MSTTNWVAYDNRNVFSHSSRGRSLRLKYQAGCFLVENLFHVSPGLWGLLANLAFSFLETQHCSVSLAFGSSLCFSPELPH